MQVNDEYIDELFAVKLGNMEATPPEDGWDRIENELNRRVQLKRKIWTAAASFALVLSVTASAYYIQSKNTTTEENTSDLHNNIYFNFDQVTEVAVVENNLQQPEELPQTFYEPTITIEDKPANIDELPSVTEEQLSITDVVDHIYNGINEIEEPNQEIAGVPETSIDHIDEEYNIPEFIAMDVPDELPIIIEPIVIDLIAVEPIVFDPISVDPIINDPIVFDLIAVNPIVVDPITVESIIIEPSIISSQFLNDPYIVSSYSRNNARVTSSRWDVKGQFTPVHSYRTISNVPRGLLISDFDQAESPLLAYSGGIALSYKLFNRLSVQTGLFYSQMGQSINDVTPVSNMNATVSSNNFYNKNFVRTSTGSVAVASNLKSDVNNTYSTYFNDEPQVENNSAPSHVNITNFSKYKLIERVDYLEIPLMLRFHIVERKLNFYILGGMSANVLLGTNVFVDNGSDLVKSGTILMARPLNYSSTVGLGLGYNIMRNISIAFEPAFKYYMKSYTTNSQIESNPYALGMSTGIVYRF